MIHITELPPEILHGIFALVTPLDLFVLPQTCRFLYHYAKDNSALCRAIYYNNFDAPPTNDLDWVREIRDIVRLQIICTSSSADKNAELSFIHDTVLRLLQNAKRGGVRTCLSITHPDSQNVNFLAPLFEMEDNRDTFLCRSFIFERAKGLTQRFSDPPSLEHQQSAKLHSLYGVPRLKLGRTRSSKMYPFACSKVYDLRQYSDKTRWGPFQGDGSDRVDWEKIEAISLVLRSNIKKKKLDAFPVFSHFWNTPFAGSWPGSYVPMPVPNLPVVKEPGLSLEAMDPYGVSGTWLRIVCFLDYSDFHRYNFPENGHELPANVPRAACNFTEATRLIIMKMRVTKIEPPSEEDGQALPVVHFRGQSRSLETAWEENANAELRGACRLTREGEVRWTTFTVYHGHARWRSEGVQVGGLRSARGVVGNWFDKDYDPHGPCGPNAFWKISDRDAGSSGSKADGDQSVVEHTDFLSLVDVVDEGNWTSEDEEYDEDEEWEPGHDHDGEEDEEEEEEAGSEEMEVEEASGDEEFKGAGHEEFKGADEPGVRNDGT